MIDGSASPHRGIRRVGPSPLSFMAWAMLLALSASLLGDMAHLLTSSHTACVEHGDVVEFGLSAAASNHDAGTTDKASVAAAATEDSEHDHCGLPMWHARAVLASNKGFSATTSLFTVAQRQARERVAAAALLYRLAPKGSPPTGA